jgi:nucleotide-binding universal stress UspA family protein
MFNRTLIVLEPEWHCGLPLGTVLAQHLALARGHKPELLFYTGLQPAAVLLAGMPDVGVVSAQDVLIDHRDAVEQLHRQAGEAADALGLLWRSVIVDVASAVPGIVEAAQVHRCDAIVVFSEGQNAVVRLLNGSCIPGLITASELPVIVCPPTLETSAGPAGERRLLVLLDPDCAATAQRLGLEMARVIDAELLFVHVMPSDLVPTAEVAGMIGAADERLSAALQEQSQRLLSTALRAARRAGLVAKSTTLPAGSTARDVAHLAVESHSSLVLAAHGGSNAVVRLLAGSLIPGLITAVTMPLLVCRAQAQPPAQREPGSRRRRERSMQMGSDQAVAGAPPTAAL